MSGHLPHIEDLVFSDGLAGMNRAVDLLWHLTRPGLASAMVKIDGSPALVFGTDPADGKFFVGTKSVFNKRTPKINKTIDDIEQNHGENEPLAHLLKMSLGLLRTLKIDHIWQADVLFTATNKQHDSTLKGYVLFKPNLITYAVPADSAVERATLGLAVHTQYMGKTIATAKGLPTLFTARSPEVWTVSPDVLRFDATLTGDRHHHVVQHLAAANQIQRSLSSELDPAHRAVLQAFEYYLVRTEQDIPESELKWKVFLDWLEDSHTSKLITYKSELGRTRAEGAHRRTVEELKGRGETIQQIWNWQREIVAVKMLFLRQMDDREDATLLPYLRINGELSRSSHEGLVITDASSTTAKLVNRAVFSHLSMQQFTHANSL
jgi:hypothetical protein